MEISKQEIESLRDQDRVKETRDVLGVIANFMAIPLYLLFWIADWIYVPHLKWEFLFVRLLIVPLVLVVQNFSKRAYSQLDSQRAALLFNFGMASAINYMIFRIGDPSTNYYAGLNLVALGNLAFIPWHFRYFLATALLIYLPYFLIVAFQFNETEQLANIAVNCFFICGTLVILFVTRIFNENLRQKELESKLALENELRHREIVIEQKSEQALRYRSLSRQFSPQVVKAIEVGEVRIDERVHNASICCLFVDIVNSTNRVTRIEKDSVDKVITMFMDDVAKTFLRFDLTIDKFLGDGVLAFSNDPVEYEDYVERAVQAAIELKARIENRHTVYESYWLNDFQIRVGLAKGVANVGFYGSENIYHSYTAIGPVVNLASRLCSVAEPNQIVTSFSVIESLEIDNYKINPIGEKNLKGFEEDRIKIFSIEGYQQKEKTGFDISDCPECSSILHIETSTKGIYILKCRSCGLEVDENTAIERSWKAS